MNPAPTPLPGSEIMIAVRNNGPVKNPALYYAGVKWPFPEGEIVEVPLSVAYFLFAVEVDPNSGQLVRDDRDYNDQGEETWFRNRLGSYEPKGLMDYGTGQFQNKYANPEKFSAFREWFRNGLEFAIVPTQTRLSPDLFNKPIHQPKRRPVAA